MGTSVGAKQQRALEQALQSNEWLRSTPKEQQPHTPSPFHSDDSSKSSVSSSAMQHADGRSLVPISSHHNAFFDCISVSESLNPVHNCALLINNSVIIALMLQLYAIY